MNKIIGLLVLGVFLMGTFAHAGVRGAKPYKSIMFSATAQELCGGPGVVYGIWSSTAAVTDYVVLRDSGTANTSSTAAIRVSPSATLATQTTFDPPVQFVNGISINAPATTNWTTITYECGRVIQGY